MVRGHRQSSGMSRCLVWRISAEKADCRVPLRRLCASVVPLWEADALDHRVLVSQLSPLWICRIVTLYVLTLQVC